MLKILRGSKNKNGPLIEIMRLIYADLIFVIR